MPLFVRLRTAISLNTAKIRITSAYPNHILSFFAKIKIFNYIFHIL
nr:MAG TPA: hypothetical protein [Caudoviricetes sp.]